MSGLGAENCRFDNEKLTGFIDGVLTQGDHQRVRLHVEDCAHCRKVVKEMQRNRSAAMSTAFVPLSDDQWDEAPRGRISRWARNFGWALLLAWLVATLGLWLWVPGKVENDLLARGLIWGSFLGWAALLLSVFLDRMRSMKGDIYREVER